MGEQLKAIENVELGYAESMPASDNFISSEPAEETCIHLGGEADPDSILFYRSYSQDPEVADAWARRIAACVNACRGVATEDLEKFGAKAAHAR